MPLIRLIRGHPVRDSDDLTSKKMMSDNIASDLPLLISVWLALRLLSRHSLIIDTLLLGFEEASYQYCSFSD